MILLFRGVLVDLCSLQMQTFLPETTAGNSSAFAGYCCNTIEVMRQRDAHVHVDRHLQIKSSKMLHLLVCDLLFSVHS